jgi:hypothetical protein
MTAGTAPDAAEYARLQAERLAAFGEFVVDVNSGAYPAVSQVTGAVYGYDHWSLIIVMSVDGCVERDGYGRAFCKLRAATGEKPAIPAFQARDDPKA